MGRIEGVGRREEILLFLKANGEATLADLAEHSAVTKQGVLRHIEALEQRGLVERASGSHEGPGRPEHRYRLTPAAAELFPHAHRELAVELVDFMERDQLDRFFEARAARVEKGYAEKLAGLDFDGRVHELARLATESGHMAEVLTMPDGSVAIRHCNCPIQDVAARTGTPCRQEMAMYQRLLGSNVERSTWLGSDDNSCTYQIKST
jgi:predicted ArsR family transcriptional regulator